MSIAALVTGTAPETSCSGIVITGAALLVMPVLAWLKRRTARSTDSRALAADSVQSATCAYLAAITLVGLGVNAIFHVPWVDALAALVALPLLVIEGRRAMQGELCDC
jgi:divalent metal cation (Fe/Co/Zn/Cd) transporter